ncbi:hypothetical protein WR25_17787 [Diploscapter pachys]|uniref:Cyclin-dependent kinases regulatory subunit n=1 Tax=Diploscapter pachys TaxID=2018661 RepID=A0A2A2LFE1_9BILA|nr:hypothetical protein WR25_17787 [Diploscapter pachys]
MTTRPNKFFYSARYQDNEYEYRHVHITKEASKRIPKNRLMSETEWRSFGIQQSIGWVHYMIHRPERHVLLFRRPLPRSSAQPNQPPFQLTSSAPSANDRQQVDVS